MTTPATPFPLMLDHLEAHSSLSKADRAALCALPYRLATLDSGSTIVRDGDKAQSSCMILSGFAYRSRLTGNGDRQILAIHMRGELVDLQNSMLPVADHNVVTLTRADLAYIPHDAIIEAAMRFPAIGAALWRDTLIEASILREWTVNLGCHSARQAVAHLICELAVRQKAAGLGEGPEFSWPLTQEQVADALGLTSVHVNRMLRGLCRDSLITIDNRLLTIANWDGLRDVGDFRSAYLHQAPQNSDIIDRSSKGVMTSESLTISSRISKTRPVQSRP